MRPLFLSLIRARPSADRVQRLATGAGPTDWRRVAELGERHKAAAILYHNLNRLGLRDHLPPDAADRLRMGYLRIISRNLRLVRRLDEVMGLLRRHGVPAVPFKGPVLARRLYGDPLPRQCGDLDFLVDRASAVAAYRALRSAGYRSVAGADLTERQFTTLSRYTKAFTFMDPQGDAAIDLHWHLSFHTRYPYDYACCRDRLTSIDIDGRPMPSLSDEDMAVYLCVHGASHGWPDAAAVVWVADIIDPRPDLDWDRVRDLAAAFHCKRMTAMGLLMAEALFDAPLPATIREWAASDPTARALAREGLRRLFHPGPKERHFTQRLLDIPCFLALRDSRTDGLRYLLKRLFLPTIKDWRGAALPSRLAFLYFLTRPVVLGADLAREKSGLNPR